MVKSRPVIVLSPRLERERRTTFIVVSLSSSTPLSEQKYHLRIGLPGTNLPPGIQKDCWVKGDMVYAVSLARLDLYRLGRKDGKRAYYSERVNNDTLFQIRKAVGHAIGLHLESKN